VWRAKSAPPKSRSAITRTTSSKHLLLNIFFAGALKAMPAKLLSDNSRHVVIRPLV
jgi:hypothetical protein